MTVWSSPLWLLGLALIPALWWLHTFRRNGTEFLVSSLIFHRPQTERDEGGKRRAAAERIWLLRAFIAGCLTLGLAGPGWMGGARKPVHVWIDDSLSMATVEEDGKSRLASALGQLRAALDASGNPAAEAHSLTDPARPSLRLPQARSGQWEALPGAWTQTAPPHMEPDMTPQPPLPLQMTPEAGHWLLTDGADGKLDDWAGQAPLDRVIQSGKTTENSAISLLALRPATDRPGAWRGLAQIDNLGRQPATRTLTLSGMGQAAQEWVVDVPAGASRQIEFDIGAADGGEVAAQLSPPDALGLDDSLALALPSAIAVRIAGDCDPPVLAALQAHPRITIGGKAQLTVVCGESAPPEDGAVLWLHRAKTAQPLKSPAIWLDGAEKLRNLYLPAEWLTAYAAEPSGNQGAKPLLLAGATALVTLQEFPRRQVDCHLGLGGAEFARQPEFPALIAGLVDVALGMDLLDGIHSRSRSIDGSRIAPLALPKPARLRQGTEAAPYDLVPGLILLLIPAVLLDLGLGTRRRRMPPAG